MYRWLFIAVLLLWLTAMTALVKRDVWPGWTAQDAPLIDAARLGSLAQARQEQFGLFGADDKRIGTAWSDVQFRPDSGATINGTILIDNFPSLPRLRVETATEFDRAGELSTFNLDVFGMPMPVNVSGERMGIYFPCKFQAGPLHGQANLDASASRMIGESLRPFTVLPKLRVGQAWRMQILDPLSAIKGGRAEFTSTVAQVTGREKISTEISGEIECFVVEIKDRQIKAWVDDDGRVLRQQAAVPGLKRLTLTAEKYDAARHVRASGRGRAASGPERGAYDFGD